MRTTATSLSKANWRQTGDGKCDELAGAKAAAEGQRHKDEGGKTDKMRLSGLHILEGRRRLESKTGQRPQGRAHAEDTGNPVPEKSCGQAYRRYLCKAQPTDARMDQLLRHREYEGLSERVRPVDAAQVRVVILKQWKKPKTVYRNLQKLNRYGKCNLNDEELFKAANSRLGLYRRSAGDVVNYLLSPKVLGTKTKDRPGLVDPLAYYLAGCT